MIEEAISKYRKINELCIKNNIYPFFKDPTNICESEKTRLDLVEIMPEEIINKFLMWIVLEIIPHINIMINWK